MDTAEEVKNGKCEEVKQDGNTGLKSVEEPQVTMGRLEHEVLFYFPGQQCVANNSVKLVLNACHFHTCTDALKHHLVDVRVSMQTHNGHRNMISS